MLKKIVAGILIISFMFSGGACARKQRESGDSKNENASRSRRTIESTRPTTKPTNETQVTLPETLPAVTEPPALNETFTSPVLRSALEEFFTREFSQITQEDLDTIQFLYINNESIFISLYPMPSDVEFSPWGEWERSTGSTLLSMMGAVDYTSLSLLLDDSNARTTEIPYEENFRDISDIEFFTGLKTLVLGMYSIDLKNLKSTMPHIQYLSIRSVRENEDFTIFSKFPGLTHLTIGGKDLIHMDGLSEMTHLEHLGLYDTGLSNLGLLSDLKNITSLTLVDNPSLPDIQTLTSMTWLKELYIEDVSYTDLNVISEMTQLERLTISDTEVKVANFLTHLTNLKYLRLDQNKNLKNIPSLANCTQLEELYLDCDNIEDFSVLEGLSNITKATLLSPDSLSFLPSYSSLKFLELKIGWLMEDISPLASLTGLEYLKLYGNTYYSLEGMSSLSNLNELKELDLSSFDNHVSFDFMYDLTGLERLNLSNNNIFSDFSRISSLTNLQILYMDRVNIYSDFKMSGVPGARGFSYQGEQTFDQASPALTGIPNLRLLSVGNNELSDLNFITNMTQLLIFNATDNYITDVSPLSGLIQLKYADLTMNAIENPNELDGLINAYILR